MPYQHVSQTAHVAYTRTLVKIYVGGALVATHRRDRTQGGYTVEESHLASNTREYRGICAHTYIARADKALKELGEVVRCLFLSSRMPPETHYRASCTCRKAATPSFS